MSFADLVSIAVFLGVLVTVHEAGHFFVAKWLNVKVVKFSIGFGPKLIGFRRGETEYQIAALPLGGFVQMAGANEFDMPQGDGVDVSRTYLGSPPWKRVLISLAGPAANLVFPLVAFFFVFLGDETSAAARIGSVEPNSPAAVAGLLPGDLIVEIDGTPIRTFEDLRAIAQLSADRTLHVTVEREGGKKTFDITPVNVDVMGLLEIQKKGRLGVAVGVTPAVLGVPAGSLGEQAGLKTLDRVVRVQDTPITSLPALEKALDEASGRIALTVLRLEPAGPGATVPHTAVIEVEPGEGKGLARLGVERGDTSIRQIVPASPAESLGLKVGDRVTHAAGRAVGSLGALEDAMELARKRQIELVWRSGSDEKRGMVGPLAPVGNAKYCMAPTDFGARFGALNAPVDSPPLELVTIRLGPVDAMRASLKRLPEGIVMIGQVLSKLPTGEVPLESMGGPVQMAQIASQTAGQGLDAFLHAMGIVSVNLALVNLLPIPILDGFNILLAIWEAIRRRPASLRVREVTTYVGFAVLGLMMVLAWRNDIARLLFC